MLGESNRGIVSLLHHPDKREKVRKKELESYSERH